MYFATNIEEIQNAMNAKAPRPIREVMLEYYPDATIDANGRAHAPHDGYVDPIYGNIYRGGEYLPFEPSDDDIIERGGVAVQWPLAAMVGGEVFMIEGTKAQKRAGGEVAKDQALEFDKTVAKHVGEVKKREVFELTLMARFVNYDGMYGPTYTHYMRDAEGNPVVYKGSTALGYKDGNNHKPMKDGDTAKIKFTVKSHWTASDGRKATYVNRPAIEG